MKTRHNTFCHSFYHQILVLARQRLVLRPLHTESEFFTCVFPYSSSFPIKMHAPDAKTQKIEPDPNFFYGRKFRRQCVNVIDTTWCRIYFSTCENFGLSVQRSLVTQKRFVNEYFSASSSLTKLTLFWCDTKSASWALSGAVIHPPVSQQSYKSSSWILTKLLCRDLV